MILEMLWNSAAFFAAIILFVKLAMRLSMFEIISAAFGTIVALSLSSLFSEQFASLSVNGVVHLVIRFLPVALILILINFRGNLLKAGVATLWIWAWLEAIFILRFHERPMLRDFIDDDMFLYLVLPFSIALLVAALRSWPKGAE